MAATRTIQIGLSFSADTTQAKSALNQLRQQLGNLLSQTSQGDLGVTNSIREAQQEATNLAVALKQATNINTGQLDLSRFQTSLTKSNTSLAQIQSKFMKIGPEGTKAFTSLANSIVAAEMPAKRTNALLASTMTTLKSAAKWSLSYSLLYGFTDAIREAYDYTQDLNKSLNDIRIVTGYNTEYMEQFAKTANKAAQSLSTTTNEYIKASLIYFQQGLSDTEVLARTEATIKMANVTGEAADAVSSYMTAIWNNFDNGSKSLEYYADVITSLGAATASSSEEIANGLQKFSAVAQTVGLSYEYATAALATVTSQTRESADTVGTAFKTIFARLESLSLGETLDDETTLTKYSEALLAVGVNIKDANGDLKDMNTILDETGQKWSEIDRDQQIALAQTVAGMRQYNNFIALLDNYEDFKINVDIATESEGTLNEQAETYAESWEAARKRVTAAAEKIYEKLLDDDFFIKVLEAIEGILGGVERFISSIGGLKGLLSGLSAILLKTFSTQIASGLETLVYNMKTFVGVTEQETIALKQQAVELMKGFKSSMAQGEHTEMAQAEYDGMEKRLEIQLQYAEKISQLNESDKAKYQIQLEILDQILERRKQIAGVVDTTSNETGGASTELREFAREEVFTRPLSSNDFDEKAFTGAVGRHEDFTSTLTQWEMMGNNFLEDMGEEALERLRQQANKLKTEIENSINLTDEDKKDLNDHIDSQLGNLSDNKETLESKKDSLKKTTKEKIKNSKQQLAQDISGSSDPAITDQYTEAINKQTDAVIKDAQAKYELDQATQRVEEHTGQMSEELKAAGNTGLDSYQKFTLATQAASSLIFAFSSISSIWETISNPDLSNWEKFSSIAMSLAIALPMLTSGLASLGKIFMASNAIQTAMNKNTLLGIALGDKKSKQLYQEIFAIGLKTKAEKGANEETIKAAMAEKLQGTAMSESAKSQLINIATTKVMKTTKDGETKAVQKNTLAWYQNPVMWIALVVVAAIAVITALIVYITKMNKALENADAANLEKAEKHAEKLAEELEKTKTKAEEVRQAFEKLSSLSETLKTLTVGTSEWRNTLLEANQIVYDLIEKSPQLANLKLGEESAIYVDEATGALQVRDWAQGYINASQTLAEEAAFYAKSRADIKVLEQKMANSESAVNDALEDILDINVPVNGQRGQQNVPLKDLGEYIDSGTGKTIKLDEYISKYIKQNREEAPTTAENLATGLKQSLENLNIDTSQINNERWENAIQSYVDALDENTRVQSENTSAIESLRLVQAKSFLSNISSYATASAITQSAMEGMYNAKADQLDKAIEGYLGVKVDNGTRGYDDSVYQTLVAEEQLKALGVNKEYINIIKNIQKGGGKQSGGAYAIGDGRTGYAEKLWEAYQEFYLAPQGIKTEVIDFQNKAWAVDELDDYVKFKQKEEGSTEWSEGQEISVNEMIDNLKSVIVSDALANLAVEGIFDEVKNWSTALQGVAARDISTLTEEEIGQIATQDEEGKWNLKEDLVVTEEQLESMNLTAKEFVTTAQSLLNTYDAQAAATKRAAIEQAKYNNSLERLAKTYELDAKALKLFAKEQEKTTNNDIISLETIISSAVGAEEIAEIFEKNSIALQNFKSDTLESAEALSTLATALGKVLGYEVSDEFFKTAGVSDAIKTILKGTAGASSSELDNAYDILFEAKKTDIETQLETQGIDVNDYIVDNELDIDKLNAALDQGILTQSIVELILASQNKKASFEEQTSTSRYLTASSQRIKTSETDERGEVIKGTEKEELIIVEEGVKYNAISDIQNLLEEDIRQGFNIGLQRADLDFDIDIYQDEEAAIESLNKTLEKQTKLSEKLYGPEKLNSIQKEIDLTYKLLEANQQALSVARLQQNIDLAAIEKYISDSGKDLKVKTDEYGRITNTENLLDAFGLDENFKELIENYNESREAVEKYSDAIVDSIENIEKYYETLKEELYSTFDLFQKINNSELSLGDVISEEEYLNLIKYNEALKDYFILTTDGYKLINEEYKNRNKLDISAAAALREQAKKDKDNQEIRDKIINGTERDYQSIVATGTDKDVGRAFNELRKNDEYRADIEQLYGANIDWDGLINGYKVNNENALAEMRNILTTLVSTSELEYKEIIASSATNLADLQKWVNEGFLTENDEAYNKQLKYLETEYETYKNITSAIDDYETKLNTLARIKERNSVNSNEWMKALAAEDEIYKEVLGAANGDLGVANGDLKVAKDVLENSLSGLFDEKGEEIKINYDEFGNIINTESILEAAKYNGQLEEVEENLNNYGEKLEKVFDLQDRYKESQIENTEALIDYNNTIRELEIDWLDYQLSLLENNSFSAAEALGILTQQTSLYEETANNAAAGIYRLASSFGVAIDENKTLGEIAATIIEEVPEASESVYDFMASYREAMESIKDASEDSLNKINQYFEELGEQFDSIGERYSHFQSVVENYKNIADLIGLKNISGITSSLKSISEQSLDISKKTYQSAKNEYDKYTKERESLETAINNTTDNELKESLKKELNSLIELQDAAYIEMQEAWNEALTTATDIFNLQITTMLQAFEEAVAGTLGSLDALLEKYDQQTEISQRYLSDHKRIYELSKLSRNIEKDIDNAQSVKAKQTLKELQEEITLLQSNGAEISAYDLEQLQKRYDLRKAEIALEEAQEAKKTVRLTRSADGNWGYIYTQNAEEVTSAEQTYEDKLYALQESSQKYLESTSQAFLQTQQEFSQAVEEIANNTDLSYEQKQNKITELTTFYQEKLKYYGAEINKVVENNKELYQQDWLAYSESTGYKIMATQELATAFGDTLLSNLTGKNSVDALIATFNLASDGVKGTFSNSISELKTNVEEIMSTAGTSLSEYGKTIENETKGIKDDVETFVSDINTEIKNTDFSAVLSSVQTLREDLQSQYSIMLEEYQRFIDSLKQQKIEVKVETITDENGEPISITGASFVLITESSTNNSPVDQYDTGGYTGHWGPTGKWAILHEKELILNAQDTANILSAVELVRNLSSSIDIQAAAAAQALEMYSADIVREAPQIIEQTVHIQAEFPNATNHSEIETAFETLLSRSSQYANRKN